MARRMISYVSPRHSLPVSHLSLSLSRNPFVSYPLLSALVPTKKYSARARPSQVLSKASWFRTLVCGNMTSRSSKTVHSSLSAAIWPSWRSRLRVRLRATSSRLWDQAVSGRKQQRSWVNGFREGCKITPRERGATTLGKTKIRLYTFLRTSQSERRQRCGIPTHICFVMS